ncbi:MULTISPECIES: heme biosynthesis HemY N-terminal domain-containing protein [unclassified Gilliamella]|jgi:HemY protein|uniref:heme biosynthesis HemY N-terminal domain-containing protein n=2 Tax=unclassified Gilliamella TaxID=2685620 RepID=UPI0009C0EC11|nr:heme biosynthesis HemY N-terminal domain-containing protein [Gilliamella apicola]
MMIKILIIFLVLVGGLFLGPLLQGQQGSAVFEFANYRISMSFNSFMIFELIGLLFLYLIYCFFSKIFSSKTALGNWLSLHSPKKSIKRIEQAQTLLLEGDYKQAAKLFVKSAKGAKNITLSYLLAAQAQINNNELIEANQSLEQAAKSCQSKDLFTFQLVQIRLQIKNHEYTAARMTLNQLLNEKPRNGEVLRLADQLYYEMGDYQAIIDLLPAMYKAKAYSELRLDQLKQTAYIGRIKQLSASDDPQALVKWWHSQPRAILNNITYQKAVADSFNQLGQTNEAEKLLKSINKLEPKERT